MRFDDMLATVLARQPERLTARVAQWRQLLDLVAQQRVGDESGLGREALARLADLRAEVPVAIRRDSALAIADRAVSPVLVRFLAADLPQVAGEVLARARLADEEWLLILPQLSPTARGFLRHRPDLSSILQAALAGFGASDLVFGATPGQIDVGGSVPALSPAPVVSPAEGVAPGDGDEPPPVEPFQPGGGEGQIRAIISRIARFRTNRGTAATAVQPRPVDLPLFFHFETGADGVIAWIEGFPREALLGETIARPAAGAFGVDAQAPGAFRRRAAFRDARLLVAGDGPAGGEWRIAGVPVFAPKDGRFLGYRGTGRRPRRDERAETLASAPDAAAAPGIAADSLRQLVHELRTPLNAVGGFAEMIRRQMRGPVSAVYRQRAQRIVEQAAQLLAAVDDLDVAARLDGARLELQRLPVDIGVFLVAVCAEQRDLVRDRGAEIACDAPAGLPRAIGDAAAIRRMIARLVAAATALAEPGERFDARLGRAADGRLGITITRPRRLAGVSESELLDPGYGPDGDWPDAPLLGLGFSLHLVRRLASAAGCALMIDDGNFTLRVPAEDGLAGIDAGG